MNAPLPRSITFGSVCSGIEAASVAWNPLGWHASWLAEIEPFPSALLAHHYPGAPNLGDMRKIPGLLRSGLIYPPDVFCGGTPCQAFSLAGLRNSLDDARGNLSLIFCKIADEIDIQRAANGFLPATVFWENVPGVLSTKDNAFGHFLAGLAGEDDPLVPAGKKWADAGCVYGPQRAVAWRVLDAQFFGLAQRRRRVYVVASARDGFDPAAILFEFAGVRRDSAPRRETGQETAGTLASRTDGGGFPGTDEACSGYIQPVEVAGTLTACYGEQTGRDLAEMPGGLQLVQAFGDNNQSGPIDVATACRAHAGAHYDFESETFLVQPVRAVALRGREGGGTAELGDDLANCLRASTGGGDKPHVLAPTTHAFDARQSDVIQYGDMAGPLDTCGYTIGVMTPAVAFSCKDHGADASVELAPTMRAMGHSGSHANAGGQLAVCVTGDIAHTLKAEGFDASEDGTGRGQPIVTAFKSGQSEAAGGVFLTEEFAPTLQAQNNGSTAVPSVQYGMAVRRLTPRECERLQGFPDDYTLIPYGRAVRMEKLEQDWIKYLLRGGVMTLDQVCRAAADGPRYKALGNSWAVPVVRRIGTRIDAELKRLDAAPATRQQRGRTGSRAARAKEMTAA